MSALVQWHGVSVIMYQCTAASMSQFTALDFTCVRLEAQLACICLRSQPGKQARIRVHPLLDGVLHLPDQGR